MLLERFAEASCKCLIEHLLKAYRRDTAEIGVHV